jgi:hypothetical protein
MASTALQARVHAAAVLVAPACAALLAACGGSKGALAPTTGTSRPPSAGAATGTAAQAAPSHAVSERMVAAAAGAVAATMNAAGHHPRVSVPWPIRFAVKDAGKPARAEVEYEYLFGGAVVARRSHYRFTGSFHDTFIWPASAVGYPLTFRAAIVSGGVKLNLDYPVQVRR